MAIKIYSKEFAALLPDVFEVQNHFLGSFGGTLQVVDGITNNDKFMDLKVTDTDVVLQDYSVDPKVAFLEGTSNTTRFGQRKEIKSTHLQVEYEAPLAIHEGIDAMTVNDDVDQVIAERTALHAEEWIGYTNSLLAKALSENASETLTGEITEAGVVKAFNDAYKIMLNNKVSKSLRKVAYVNADVYAVIMDSKLATTAKSSTANIDDNTILKFKGFVVEEIADEYFEEGENILFVADNVGVAGIGVQVYRALDSEDFAGITIQAAAKYGKHIPEKNKKAIIKATLTEAQPESV